MEPKVRITHIKNRADLANIDEIAELPRGINWKFIFGAAILSEREKIVVSEEGFQSILQQVTTKSPLSSIWYRFMQFWKK